VFKKTLRVPALGSPSKPSCLPRLSPAHRMPDPSVSPFVRLAVGTQYVDVLCVNCYQCVPFLQVDPHSNECQGNTKQPKWSREFSQTSMSSVLF